MARHLFLPLCLILLLGCESYVRAQGEPSRQESIDSAASVPANNMGMNIGPPLDYTPNRPFADVMKISRDWRSGNNPAAVDLLGWPTQDASIIVWAGIGSMQGTYRLSFTGKANVATGFGSASISNKSYDAVSNTTTATLVYNSTDDSGLQLTFSATQRTAASAINTGVTNVSLMRPRTVGGTMPYTTEIFTDQFKSVLAKFS